MKGRARAFKRKRHDFSRIRRPPPGTGLPSAREVAGDRDRLRLDRFGEGL